MGAFSVITNLRMDFFEALVAEQWSVDRWELILPAARPATDNDNAIFCTTAAPWLTQHISTINRRGAASPCDDNPAKHSQWTAAPENLMWQETEQ